MEDISDMIPSQQEMRPWPWSNRVFVFALSACSRNWQYAAMLIGWLSTATVLQQRAMPRQLSSYTAVPLKTGANHNYEDAFLLKYSFHPQHHLCPPCRGQVLHRRTRS